MKILLVLIILIGFSCKENPIFVSPIEEYNFNIKNARETTDGEKSLSFSLKALESAKKLKDSIRIAHSYFEISNDYIQIGDLKRALQNILQSFKIYKNKFMLNELGMTYNQIGRIYKQNNKDSALYYMNKAIEIHKKLNKTYSIAEDYNNLGEIYRMNYDYNNALKNLKISDSIFTICKDTTNRIYTLQSIGLSFAYIGLLDSANYHISLSTEMLKKQSAFRSKCEILKKENAIKKLKYTNNLKSRANIILFISVLIIIILLVLLINLNVNLRCTNKLLLSQKIELEESNETIKFSLEEKEVLLKQISHLNNLIIKDSLFIKKDDVFHKVKIKDILFIKSEGNYLEVYTNTNFRYIIRCTIKSFLEHVIKYSFFQTHKSYVINLEHIDSVSSRYVKIKQFEVPLSQSKKDELLPLISSFT